MLSTYEMMDGIPPDTGAPSGRPANVPDEITGPVTMNDVPPLGTFIDTVAFSTTLVSIVRD